MNHQQTVYAWLLHWASMPARAIARGTGLSHSTVIAALRRLRERGIVEMVGDRYMPSWRVLDRSVNHVPILRGRMPAQLANLRPGRRKVNGGESKSAQDQSFACDNNRGFLRP